MKLRTLLLVVLLVALLAGGGTAVVVIENEKQRVRRALREAGVKLNVDPDILDALGYVESRWRMNARNLTGADGARGGAWGPTQITEKTARAHGYTGPMAALTTDPDLAATWTARILRNRPGGPPETIQDAAAWWNAGKTSATALGPSHVTRTDYIPKALAALTLVRQTPVTA